MCKRLQSRIMTKLIQPQFISIVKSTTQKSQNDESILVLWDQRKDPSKYPLVPDHIMLENSRSAGTSTKCQKLSEWLKSGYTSMKSLERIKEDQTVSKSLCSVQHIKHRISGQEPFSIWNMEVGEEWFYKNEPF